MQEQLTLNIQEIQVGAIVRNLMATNGNPLQFFIYQYEKDGVANGLGLYEDELIMMQCFVKNIDGINLLEVVGHSKSENYQADLSEVKTHYFKERVK